MSSSLKLCFKAVVVDPWKSPVHLNCWKPLSGVKKGDCPVALCPTDYPMSTLNEICSTFIYIYKVEMSDQTILMSQ